MTIDRRLILIDVTTFMPYASLMLELEPDGLTAMPDRQWSALLIFLGVPFNATFKER